MINDGIEYGKIDISRKEFYLVGRHPKLCDIVVKDISVSRVHAAIQHKDTGEVLLYDLDSTHGTYLNRIPVKKREYVPLSPGDVFYFGKSKRTFVLSGVVEDTNMAVDTSNLVNEQELLKKRKDKVLRQFKESQQQRETLMKQEMSWGMKDFDSEIYSEEQRNKEEAVFLDENFNLDNVKKMRLTDKQQKMVGNIETLRRQLKRIDEQQAELKGRGDLSTGAIRKVHELEVKKEGIEDKIETSEENLRISLSAQDSEKETKFDRNKAKRLNREEEGELYFEQEKEANTSKKGDYNTLKREIELMNKRKTEILRRLDEIEQNESKNIEGEDSLDAFMRMNDSLVYGEEKTKLQQELKELAENITKAHKILTFVAPSKLENTSRVDLTSIKIDSAGLNKEELKPKKKMKMMPVSLTVSKAEKAVKPVKPAKKEKPKAENTNLLKEIKELTADFKANYFEEIVKNVGKDFKEADYSRIHSKLNEDQSLLEKKRLPQYSVQPEAPRNKEEEEALEFSAQSLPSGEKVNLNN